MFLLARGIPLLFLFIVWALLLPAARVGAEETAMGVECASAERLSEENPRVGLAALLTNASDRSPRLLRCVELPEGARQGPREWYRLSLDLEATVTGPPGGSVVVSLLTAGAAAAQVHFSSTPDGLFASGSSVNGMQQAGPVSGSAIQLRFENYWQTQGVRTGSVPVELTLEQYGGARLQRLELLDRSYLEWTVEPPYPLTVVLSVPSDVDVGASFDAFYTASWRASGKSSAQVMPTVESVETSAGLAVERVQEPKGDNSNSASGAIRLKTTTMGSQEVTLRMAMGDEAAATVAVTLAGPERGGTWLGRHAWSLWFAAGAMLLVVPALLCAIRRHAVRR
jgi:hypothetical protein